MAFSGSIKRRLCETETAQWVRSMLRDQPALKRTALALAICRRLDLRDGKGDWQVATTAKALRDCEAQGLWCLPASTSSRQAWSPKRLNKRVPTPRDLPALLDDIQGLCLIEVIDPEHVQIWNELMLHEHPLKQCRLVGRQLRYLIGSNHGWLGGLGFGSAALYLEGRDDWIGWNGEQRREHLQRVLSMTRFLIRPMVRCPNLASHVLGLCARRVGSDFERRYGLRPWLLESFVETPTFEGACYKAANWIQTGRTKGRGRNGARQPSKSFKDIYVYPLADDFRDRIGVKPTSVEALPVECGLDGAGWAAQEFGNCELGDKRLSEALVEIAGAQSTQPQASYSQAIGGKRHQLKAYYRFLNNEREELNPTSLLGTHRAQTIRRIKNEQTVLVVQDTTDLNLSTRVHCRGLGQIGTNQTGAKSRGLRLHSSLALTPNGLPLGLLQVNGYAPQSAQGKDPQRPIEEKDSYRWIEGFCEAMKVAQLLPDTQVISVADREADMFELFDFRRRQIGRKAELLIRAKSDRCLADSEAKLFDELAAEPLAQTVSITLPRQRERVSKPSEPGRVALAARQASVEIRYKRVTLSAPGRTQTRHLRPISLWAISILERNPPAGATRVEWLLLTTIEVSSAKQAMKCIRLYCRRWRIEEWHRVLKSGCNILEHQNHSAEALLRVITIDAVIAWRLMLLTLLGREVPELPAESVFDPCECEVLELLQKKVAPSAGLPSE
jgi:hypothetical protein